MQRYWIIWLPVPTLAGFAGLGYLAQPEMPPIIGTEDRVWRGIFYHTGEEAGAFSSVCT